MVSATGVWVRFRRNDRELKTCLFKQSKKQRRFVLNEPKGVAIVSYSFYLFGEFAEVLVLTGKSDAYKKLICIVERVHFYVRVGVKT